MNKTNKLNDKELNEVAGGKIIKNPITGKTVKTINKTELTKGVATTKKKNVVGLFTDEDKPTSI